MTKDIVSFSSVGDALTVVFLIIQKFANKRGLEI